MRQAEALKEQALRRAPRGFSPDEWETFLQEGVLHLTGRVSDAEVSAYREAAQACLSAADRPDGGHTWKLLRAVERHPLIESLIDGDHHVGYAYDFFGDQLHLVQSEIVARPRKGVANAWHVDGSRVVPFSVYSAHAPLKLKVAYWLTDLPSERMGNFVYIPGSHLPDFREELSGREPHPNEVSVKGRAGMISLLHCGVWHRVDRNETPNTRLAIFLTYAPSWLRSYYPPDPAWAASLPRERRIIMRPYEESPKDFIRPPARDLPLFLDRETGATETEGSDEPELHKRRRPTGYEKYLRRRGTRDSTERPN
jgi:hypothetical protein